MPVFSPHEHAERLRIPIVYVPGLPEPGRWYPTRREIRLRAGMTAMQERSVLAHELAHAILGHPHSTPKLEAQADRWAARRLVTVDDLERVAMESDDPGRWCVDLVVTPHLLTIAMSLHRRELEARVMDYAPTP